MPKISLFKDTLAVTPSQVDIDKVLQAIRSDTYKTQIEAIRALPNDSDEQGALKKKLPAVTFGGTFSYRSMNNLKEASGLLTLDFDIAGYVIPDSLLPFAYTYFRSPRGGLKVVVRIPAVSNDHEFKEYYYAIQEAYPELDDSGKDIVRLCYLSHDPDLVINEQAQTWTTRKIIAAPPPRPRSDESTLHRKTITSNFSKMTIAMGMIRSAPQGHRTAICFDAGRLIGGYIAGGEIAESEVVFFEGFIQTNAPDDYKDHIRSFRNGVDKGKQDPLKDRDRSRKAIKATYKATEHFPVDIAFDLDEETESKLWERWKTGRKRGYTTGWDCLDQHYSMLLGSTTYVYGAPTAGKSYFLMNLLVNTSRMHGWNHIVFSPESGFHEDIFDMLIEIYTGKDTTDEFGNKATEEEVKEAIAFIRKHFTIIDPEINGADEDLDVATLMNYVEYICTKKQYHTVTIDPIVELKTIQDNEREDLFLKKALSLFRRTCKVLNLHGFIAVHIRSLGAPTGTDSEGNAYWRPASFYDLAGGQMWSRKGFMILGLWRHKFYQGEEIELKKLSRFVKRNHTLVSIVKVKPKGAGTEGECWLKFDVARNQFVDPNQMHAEPPPVRDYTQSKAQEQQEINYDEPPPMWVQ